MPTADKIDLFKLHKADYAAPKRPALVELDPVVYLAISGRGGPESEEFQARIGALYGMAYTVKMTRKFGGRQDYTICKLETRWWTGDDDPDLEGVPREDWRWTLMIRTPEFVEQGELDEAARKLTEKNKGACTDAVALETLAEGRCVQMLHVGPYENEPETVEAMRAFAAGEGLRFDGLHHEIYLSDPRRVAPERLKTILRRPVAQR